MSCLAASSTGGKSCLRLLLTRQIAIAEHCHVLLQYGKQYVPVSADDEAYLAYKPERGIHLLGFLPAAGVPQYQYMKACFPEGFCWI